MAVYKLLGIQEVNLGYKTTGMTPTIAEVDFTFANAFAIDANINTITFEGDGTSEQVPISNGITGTVSQSKFNTDILDQIAGITAVTMGLPVGAYAEAKRYYPQQGAYPYVQIRVVIKAIDEATGGFVRLQVLIFRAKIQSPWTPGDLGNQAAVTTELAWTSVETGEDLLGVALPGVTAPSVVHYAVSVLS